MAIRLPEWDSEVQQLISLSLKLNNAEQTVQAGPVVTLFISVWEVFGLHLGSGTGYPDRKFVVVFLSPCIKNIGTALRLVRNYFP
jgi:hypothetical protein